MIYIDDRIDQIDFHAALHAVSPQRREHALKYKHEHDQRLSLAAYQLLQRALCLEYGIVEPPIFDFGTYGKPSIVGHSDIHFSLSHCHEAAACIVADSPVGIDVESISNYDAEIVAVAMNDNEQKLIANSPDPSITFIRLWTMKESLLKMTGEGMVADIRHVLTNLSAEQKKGVHFHTTIYFGFACTVCVMNANIVENIAYTNK